MNTHDENSSEILTVSPPTRKIQLLFIVIFTIMVCAPIIYTVAAGVSSKLGGVTKRSKESKPTVQNILNGSFQKQIEQKFGRWLSIFAPLVKTDNQISLWLFQQVSSNPKSRVIMGNRGHLIERAYLGPFNRQGVPKKSTLASVANQLSRLEKALAQRNKAFILLISTNKPNFYPDLVPSWYKVPGAQDKPSGYELFLPLLRLHGVEPLDSRSLLRSVESTEHAPIFSPTGTHWNEYAACRVTSELASRIAAQLPNRVGSFHCQIEGQRTEPTDQDMDLLKITNLLFPRALIRPAPRVVSKVLPTKNVGTKPRLLMIGTSFCWELLQVLNRNPVFSNREFLYYFQRQVLSRGGKQRNINKDQFDILGAIDRSDAVVIEVNEAFVHRAGYGFIERALKALKGVPPVSAQ